MRRIGLAAIIGAATLVLAGCATMGVSSFVERGADFSQYRTYGWAPADLLPTGDPRLDNNAIFRDHFEGAVERGMAARGYARVPEYMSPDLLLHYHANVEQRFYVDTNERGYGDDNEPRTIAYEAGTLVIDVVDRRTNTLVWRGWAEDSFDHLMGNQRAMEEKVEEAVTRMLERLPNPAVITSGVLVSGY